jgi:hypothetical protein
LRTTLAVVGAALVLCATSAAAWSVRVSGNGNAKAITLVGAKPTASASGTVTISVALSWAATPRATGYLITRTGGVGAVGGTCTGTVAATTCTDTPVIPLQTYTYTVTPISGGWTGTPSPATSVST